MRLLSEDRAKHQQKVDEEKAEMQKELEALKDRDREIKEREAQALDQAERLKTLTDNLREEETALESSRGELDAAKNDLARRLEDFTQRVREFDEREARLAANEQAFMQKSLELQQEEVRLSSKERHLSEQQAQIEADRAEMQRSTIDLQERLAKCTESEKALNEHTRALSETISRQESLFSDIHRGFAGAIDRISSMADKYDASGSSHSLILQELAKMSSGFQGAASELSSTAKGTEGKLMDVLQRLQDRVDALFAAHEKVHSEHSILMNEVPVLDTASGGVPLIQRSSTAKASTQLSTPEEARPVLRVTPSPQPRAMSSRYGSIEEITNELKQEMGRCSAFQGVSTVNHRLRVIRVPVPTQITSDVVLPFEYVAKKLLVDLAAQEADIGMGFHEDLHEISINHADITVFRGMQQRSVDYASLEAKVMDWLICKFAAYGTVYKLRGFRAYAKKHVKDEELLDYLRRADTMVEKYTPAVAMTTYLRYLTRDDESSEIHSVCLGGSKIQ
jgi:hypothetical protein